MARQAAQTLLVLFAISIVAVEAQPERPRARTLNPLNSISVRGLRFDHHGCVLRFAEFCFIVNSQCVDRTGREHHRRSPDAVLAERGQEVGNGSDPHQDRTG